MLPREVPSGTCEPRHQLAPRIGILKLRSDILEYGNSSMIIRLPINYPSFIKDWTHVLASVEVKYIGLWK